MNQKSQKTLPTCCKRESIPSPTVGCKVGQALTQHKGGTPDNMQHAVRLGNFHGTYTRAQTLDGLLVHQERVVPAKP